MLYNQNLVTIPFDRPELAGRSPALATVLDLSNHLSAEASPQGVLEVALEHLLEAFDLDAGRAYLMDPDGAWLSLKAHRGVDPTGLEYVRLDQGFTGMAARSRSFLAMRVKELNDPERVCLLADRGFEAVICLPLIALDQVVGVMNLAARRIISLDLAGVDLMMVLGNLAAVALTGTMKSQALAEQKEAIQFFAFTASHDLKSPAAGIHGLAQRMLTHCDEHLDQRARTYAQQIVKASARIEALVSEINGYIRAKEGELKLEDVDLGELLDDLRRELKPRLAERGVAWVQPDRLPMVRADRLALVRMLMNYLDNALKYGGEGLTTLEVAYRRQDAEHVLCVADDGVGLPPDAAARAFGLFQRLGAPSAVEGTGLGLAIVSELARRHRGRAWLEPTHSPGACFCFSLAAEN